MVRHFRPRGAVQDTGVACPACAQGELEVQSSCLRTRVFCAGCAEEFELAELARRLDDAAFEVLEQALGGRLSDRV